MSAGVRYRVRQAVLFTYLARKEWRSPARLRHVEIWRRGFVSESHELYGFGAGADPALYLSDWAHQMRTGAINGTFGTVLTDKILFHAALAARFSPHLPRLLGAIRRGEFRPSDPGGPGGGGTTIADCLETLGSLVVKPVAGFGGHHVHVLHPTPGGATLDGAALTMPQLQSRLDALDGCLVEGYVRQDGYSAAIFPGAVNTMRLLTLRDVTSGTPFLAAAVHRFGTTRSAPVDNWTQGGLNARIDLGTGELGPGLSFTAGGRLVRLPEHPDTGSPIAGVSVPRWSEVKDLALAVAGAFPTIDYAGWDLVLGEDGPLVIEGNNMPGPNVFQVHAPLLADERVRTFYEHHGVLRRRRA